MRYFVEFSYNGANYHGWQFQPNAISVQQTLNEALSLILGQKVDAMGAGRTDTGVHARQMYAHFDFDGFFDCSLIVHKINSYLPSDIAIHEIFPVDDAAHARFDASSRTYEYQIHTRKNVFLNGLSWYHHNTLDVVSMNTAAQSLLAHQDFECFSKTNTDVNTYNCNITKANWQQTDYNLVFTITADRFLRNMVRAIVGTLINVGSGKIGLADFENIILSKQRSMAGFSVPAHGLYLTQIKYPYVK